MDGRGVDTPGRWQFATYNWPTCDLRYLTNWVEGTQRPSPRRGQNEEEWNYYHRYTTPHPVYPALTEDDKVCLNAYSDYTNFDYQSTAVNYIWQNGKQRFDNDYREQQTIGAFEFVSPNDGAKMCVYEGHGCTGRWYELLGSLSCRIPQFTGKFSYSIVHWAVDCANAYPKDYRDPDEIAIDAQNEKKGEQDYDMGKENRMKMFEKVIGRIPHIDYRQVNEQAKLMKLDPAITVDEVKKNYPELMNDNLKADDTEQAKVDVAQQFELSTKTGHIAGQDQKEEENVEDNSMSHDMPTKNTEVNQQVVQNQFEEA